MSHNTWIHRAVTVAVRPLVRTPVTPNHLTTLRLLAGLSAAAFFAFGERDMDLAGSGLFVLSLLLDRADGILARLSGRTSDFGHAYDLISDGICDTLIFVGIGIGLSHGGLGAWTIALGLVAGLAISGIFLIVMRMEAREGPRAAELTSMAGFDADDGILLAPVCVLLGQGLPMLIAAAIATPLVLLFFL